mgnify:CR=1 FL=1
MKKAILATKIGMTQIWDKDGVRVPVTVIEAGPCVVTQLKTVEKDGYEALQLGFVDKTDKHTTKPMAGHFKKAGVKPQRFLAEFKGFDGEHKTGEKITVELFNDVEFVDVIGTTKGKGFQGVVKRHGFGGVGGQTHGQDDRLRAPGSMGASSWPSRVFKGKRLAGRMGGDKVKILNLKVIKVIPENNLLLVKGSIPGATGSYVIVEG